MEKLTLNIHVGQLADITTPVYHILTSLEGRQYFDKEYKDVTFSIDYPMEIPFIVHIPKGNSLADALVPLADAYKNHIYKNPEQQGVYGHDLNDLFFEGIIINDDGTGELIMGS